MNKHKARPDFELNGLEAELFGIKVLELSKAWCSAETAIEAISPAMIRAGEKLRVALPFNEASSMMSTYVVKSSQLALLVAGHDDWLFYILVSDIVTTLLEFCGGAKVEPMLQKEFVLFGHGKVLVEVPRAWRSPRILDILLRIEVTQFGF